MQYEVRWLEPNGAHAIDWRVVWIDPDQPAHDAARLAVDLWVQEGRIDVPVMGRSVLVAVCSNAENAGGPERFTIKIKRTHLFSVEKA